jgi:hypothetical protein
MKRSATRSWNFDQRFRRIRPADHVLAQLRRGSILLRVKIVRVTEEAQRREELLSLRLLASLLPAVGRELEDLALLPGRQESEDVAQVGRRLDGVKATAGDERDGDRVPASAVLTPAEEPVLGPDLLVRSCNSEMLLSSRSRPSVRKRRRAMR